MQAGVAICWFDLFMRHFALRVLGLFDCLLTLGALEGQAADNGFMDR